MSAEQEGMQFPDSFAKLKSAVAIFTHYKVSVEVCSGA